MDLGSSKNVFDVLETIKSSSPDDSLFVCMWSASHKIKKKAEQECCKMAIKMCK